MLWSRRFQPGINIYVFIVSCYSNFLSSGEDIEDSAALHIWNRELLLGEGLCHACYIFMLFFFCWVLFNSNNCFIISWKRWRTDTMIGWSKYSNSWIAVPKGRKMLHPNSNPSWRRALLCARSINWYLSYSLLSLSLSLSLSLHLVAKYFSFLYLFVGHQLDCSNGNLGIHEGFQDETGPSGRRG